MHTYSDCGYSLKGNKNLLARNETHNHSNGMSQAKLNKSHKAAINHTIVLNLYTSSDFDAYVLVMQRCVLNCRNTYPSIW